MAFLSTFFGERDEPHKNGDAPLTYITGTSMTSQAHQWHHRQQRWHHRRSRYLLCWWTPRSAASPPRGWWRPPAACARRSRCRRWWTVPTGTLWLLGEDRRVRQLPRRHRSSVDVLVSLSFRIHPIWWHHSLRVFPLVKDQEMRTCLMTDDTYL